MDRDQALRALEATEHRLRTLIPAEAPSWGRRHFGYVIEEHVGAARLHLGLIYDHGCAVGPGLTPLPEFASHPKYAFWAEGVQRHLEICESTIEARPDTDAGVD